MPPTTESDHRRPAIGSPAYRELLDQVLDDELDGGLCDAYPTELACGPCILDVAHPEPEHTNLDGDTWVDGGLVTYYRPSK